MTVIEIRPHRWDWRLLKLLVSARKLFCAHIARTNGQTSAVGTVFMDSQQPKTLKATLQAIRDLATNALNQFAESQEDRSMRWKCKECEYIKHFTRPVPFEGGWQMSEM